MNDMKPTLLILAAGMASRYGSMKQIQGFGPGGETLMEYSIYDAIRSGFGKIVFVIRKDFAENFKMIFEAKLKNRIAIEYVYQDMNDFIDGYTVPAERKKPWGTAHAVLTGITAIKEPFAVINADDFYGRDAFDKAYGFLTKECNEKLYSIIGYDLINTLSEHGSVSRGVCEVDKNSFLITIKERTKIFPENGKIIYEDNEGRHEVPTDLKVSLNFWCFHPTVFEFTQKTFLDFLKKNSADPKAEFFIPIVADEFIQKGIGRIKVVPTTGQWFGVTYKEDAPIVEKSLLELVKKGEYPAKLWS